MRASTSPRRAAPRVGAGTRRDRAHRRLATATGRPRCATCPREAAFTPYYSLNARERGRLAYLAEIVLTEPDAATLPTGIPVEVTLAAGRAAP